MTNTANRQQLDTTGVPRITVSTLHHGLVSRALRVRPVRCACPPVLVPAGTDDSHHHAQRHADERSKKVDEPGCLPGPLSVALSGLSSIKTAVEGVLEIRHYLFSLPSSFFLQEKGPKRTGFRSAHTRCKNTDFRHRWTWIPLLQKRTATPPPEDLSGYRFLRWSGAGVTGPESAAQSPQKRLALPVRRTEPGFVDDGLRHRGNPGHGLPGHPVRQRHL